MSESSNESNQPDGESDQTDRSEESSSSPREPGEVGIRDEDLPEDLQPTDDNPLAQSPEEQDADGDAPDKVEGMPDVGNPAGS